MWRLLTLTVSAATRRALLRSSAAARTPAAHLFAAAPPPTPADASLLQKLRAHIAAAGLDALVVPSAFAARFWRRVHGVETRIVRIFNTFGERMQLDDGRALCLPPRLHLRRYTHHTVE